MLGLFLVSTWAQLLRGAVYPPGSHFLCTHLPLGTSLGVRGSGPLNLPAPTPSLGHSREVSNPKSGQEVKENLDGTVAIVFDDKEAICDLGKGRVHVGLRNGGEAGS